MKLDNYKTIKKSEWQEIASTLGIDFAKEDVVRILLEKISEKLLIEFKNVSDNDLKKSVVAKINEEFDLVLVDDEDSEEVVTEKPLEEVSSEEEEVVEQPIVDKVSLSRLEELRLECESYGIAWAEAHTEESLLQVLNAVKGSGVQPTAPVNEVPKTTTNTDSFEISSENVSEVAKEVENAPAPAPQIKVETQPQVSNINSSFVLENFATIYLHTIQNHFRLLSIGEIDEMIKRDKQMFTHTIRTHAQHTNKIEIILTQGSSSIRIPSNNSEWIDING